MPAKIKASEYDSHYKWLESFRAKGFKPAAEQIAPAAGKGSIFSLSVDEPALQHKRRVDGPPTSLSVNYDAEGKVRAYDDFALLGKQDKFASNVRYPIYRPPKPSKPSKAPEKEKDLNANNRNVNSSNNNDIPPPAKQIKIDDLQFQPQPRRKPDLKGDATKVDKDEMRLNLTPSSPPPAPRKVKHLDLQPVKEGLKDKNLSDVLPKKSSSKTKTSKTKMNETVQTNMAKGVALSAPEATSNYSLQYKAGLTQPRLTRKVSEYQKEYNWKQGLKASPLLSAEQIVYNSVAIAPTKKDVFPKRTEYQMQFKQFPLSDPPVSFAPKTSKEEPARRGRSKARTQPKRSKSAGAGLSPDRLAAAGSGPFVSPDDPRLLRESRDGSPVPKVPIAYGSLKREVSEYKSNFKAPESYSYDGAWKDAFPPHLFQNKSKKKEPKLVEPLDANWFAEVLELRRRANEYKKRAQGTHFSREHLVQLLGKQTGYWDLDSNQSARSLDALALEPGKVRVDKLAPSSEKEQVPMDAMSHVAVRGDSPEPSVVETKPGKRKGKGKKGKKARTAWQEAPEPIYANQNQNAHADLNLNRNARADDDSPYQDVGCQAQFEEDAAQLQSDEEGRLPTPVLRQTPIAGQASIRPKAYRHHLDRTTPSVGGLLLASLPEPVVPSSDRSGETEETADSGNGRRTPPRAQKSTSEKLRTSLILGKPTPDTHFLRDDDTDSDHVMPLQYVGHPSEPLARVDKNLKALQRKMNAKIPNTINEGVGGTYNKDVENFHVEDLPLCKPRNGDDDDVLSVSAMSIASSSSLASEVYERARKRRDDFWGKPSK